MYIVLLLPLSFLRPAFELPSKVSTLFFMGLKKNRVTSFTRYQPFGQPYLQTSQLQFSTKIKNYTWSLIYFLRVTLYILSCQLHIGLDVNGDLQPLYH